MTMGRIRGHTMLLLTLFLAAVTTSGVIIPKEHSHRRHFDSQYNIRNHVNAENLRDWAAIARAQIEKKTKLPRIETPAKNMILFIGDGMGVSTVTASRIFKGQTEKMAFGEEVELYMDTFPYTGTAKTYCSDLQVADSACSTTAYSCGVKSNVRTIGVTSNVLYQNCTASMQKENRVESVLAWAQIQGMSTGIVTTTAITDASPAGSYAHVANRNWENDDEIVKHGLDPATCDDIAEQLILRSPGKGINVILGGGRQHFMKTTSQDPENPVLLGRRKDGQDLLSEWGRHKTKNSKYITSRDELLALHPESTDFLLGLFAHGDLEYVDKQLEANDPSLAEMTDIAIKILSKNSNGFFLFVEGGKIDHAHHGNNAQRALAETLELDKAIQLADNLTCDEDTLIVISSDHSHLMTIAGDFPTNTSILGFTKNTDTPDGLPVTTLSYINGPGYREPEGESCSRHNISNDNVTDINYKQISSYYRDSATHAGEDVLVFAKGPWAHLFIGINDQTFIAHAMKHAAFNRNVNNQATKISTRGTVGLISFFLLTQFEF